MTDDGPDRDPWTARARLDETQPVYTSAHRALSSSDALNDSVEFAGLRDRATTYEGDERPQRNTTIKFAPYPHPRDTNPDTVIYVPGPRERDSGNHSEL